MNVTDLASNLQRKMGELADRLGRETGFIKRQRRVSGSNFIQTLVFKWLSKPDASLTELVSSGHESGLEISVQGLHKRFTSEAVDFCRRLLEEMLKELAVAKCAVDIELLARFNEVWLIDTTVNALPELFREQWPGTGGSTDQSNQAALKVEAALEIKHGALRGSFLPGKTNDNQGPLVNRRLPAGSLLIADLGYFSLERKAQLNAQGVYWLSRLRHDTVLHDEQGQPLDLLKTLRACAHAKMAFSVQLGHARLPARLLVYRVPEQVANERRRKMHRDRQKKGRTPDQRSLELCGWTLLITNAPVSHISLDEAVVLYGSRWQIELLFKLWKQHMKINQSVSQNAQRILGELYIKLMAALVQHWIVLSSPCWQLPEKSLVKAYKVIASHSAFLARVFSNTTQLARALKELGCVLTKVCRQNKRKKHPNTWIQLTSGLAGWSLS